MGQERRSSTAFVLRSRFVTSAFVSKLPSLFGFVPETGDVSVCAGVPLDGGEFLLR